MAELVQPKNTACKLSMLLSQISKLYQLSRNVKSLVAGVRRLEGIELVAAIASGSQVATLKVRHSRSLDRLRLEMVRKARHIVPALLCLFTRV